MTRHLSVAWWPRGRFDSVSTHYGPTILVGPTMKGHSMFGLSEVTVTNSGVWYFPTVVAVLLVLALVLYSIERWY